MERPTWQYPDAMGDDGAHGTRSELTAIARLAVPIALAQFGMTLLGLVDVAVLGHASTTELGGASIGRSIGFVSVAFGMGMSAALEPLAAQAMGAREPRRAWRAFVACLGACVLIWAPTSLLALLATYLLAPLGIAPELIAPARAFLLAHLPGLLALLFFLSCKAYLQARGQTAPALVAALVANVVNLVVCNALVRGELPLPGGTVIALGWRPMGALGAGLASSVAAFVMAAWVLLPALRTRPRVPEPSDAALASPPNVRRVLTLGTPIGLQWLAEVGVFSVVAVLAGRLGEVAVAAHQIAIGLSSFTFMGVLGVSGATAVRVGHAVGEGRSPRLAGLLGIALGAGFMAVCGVVFLAAPRWLVSFFSDDPAIASLGVTLLGIAAAFQLFDGVQGVAAGALRGAGDVHVPFLANVGAHWLVGFPLAMLFGFVLRGGAPGLWWGLLVGLAVVATALCARFVMVARRPIRRV